jgi:long-chain acyl-CoA synthetase
MNPSALVAAALPPFRTLSALVAEQAAVQPNALALSDALGTITYANLNHQMNQVAAALQSAGLQKGDVVALCGVSSVAQAVVFMGALRSGVVVAPLAPSATAQQLAAMALDCGAKLCFLDAAGRQAWPATGATSDTAAPALPRVSLDGQGPDQPLQAWLAASTALAANGNVLPTPVDVQPGDAFNIIYSSGTTGAPKGIVQPHGMRWAHVMRASRFGYSNTSVLLLATPLYSNTTLVAFFAALAWGGHVHLMAKFNAADYLATAQQLRATHTMLVPVQYRRIMALPSFDSHDLSAFHTKLSTSAPFEAALKADILARWPGGLVELYGLTEGGGTVILDAHLHPTKLHTVGQPSPGHDVRLVDEAGVELPAGQGLTGEVVGHSPGMMTRYHNQPAKTAEAEWFDASGKRFIRTGDVARFDEDGFLVLMDRRKDMVISGGFNIYPSDLEAVLLQHPAVHEAAVVGVPSAAWGETPVAFVVLRAGATATDADLLQWCNAQVGKTQRLHTLRTVAELPRSAIGKVLKRELREQWVAAQQSLNLV